KPFYHRDDFSKTTTAATKASQFKICQNIFVFDVEKSVERSLDSLKRGAESLRFTIENETVDIQKLLEKLPLENTAIHFDLKFLSVDFISKINTTVEQKKATVFYNLDPIGQ